MSRVGFTGSRKGMTQAQRAAVTDWLRGRRLAEFHHGRCVGSDEEAHEIVLGLACCESIHGHPCDLVYLQSNKCEFSERDVLHPVLPPLDRNRVIVGSSDVLLATPAGPEEHRSGTWMTIRYARKVGVPVVIFMPDGQVVDLACRNMDVFNERQRIINEIHEISRVDRVDGRDWEWRYRQFNEGPSYEEMLYQLWRPVESFFPPVAEWRQ